LKENLLSIIQKVENEILDQKDYAEGDAVNHSIVVENTDSPIDESH